MTEQQKAAIEEAATKAWGDDVKHNPNPNPNNPYAYRYGFKQGAQHVIEHPERYGLMVIPAPTVLPKESDHPEYGKHGMCKRCNRTQAVMDYNGHGYWVCNSCDDALGREFDEEYR